MSSLPFIKIHGLGNDFVVIDGLTVPRAELKRQEKIITGKFAEKICDRRFGVGADQILWIKPPKSASAVATMDVINADGTMAEMCGNGIRAVGIYLNQIFQMGKKTNQAKSYGRNYMIDTGAGLLTVVVKGDQVRVDMGAPKFGSKKRPSAPEMIKIGKKEILFFAISMGNPHAVIFVDDLKKYPAEIEGPAIERNKRFPKRTNVEFVEILGARKIKVRVWERGAGFTLACGTGACAAAVAAIQARHVTSPVTVVLPGGELLIEWNGKLQSPVFMTGPAEEVFRGGFVLD